MKHIIKYKLLKPFPNHQVGEIVVKTPFGWRFENENLTNSEFIPRSQLSNTEFFEPIYVEYSQDYYYVIIDHKSYKKEKIAVLQFTSKHNTEKGFYFVDLNDNRNLYSVNDIVPNDMIPKSEVIDEYWFIHLDYNKPLKNYALESVKSLYLYLKRKSIGNVFIDKESVDFSKVLWGKHIVGNNGELYYNSYANDVK